PSILGVLARSFSIMFSHAARESINKSDIVIYPDVEGYRWGDFHLGKELICRGEEACLKKIEEIEKLISGEPPAVGSRQSAVRDRQFAAANETFERLNDANESNSSNGLMAES
ncbi:MAG: hypothetical protein Q8O04_01970, partial [Deltaproteobacteria bacterium]|nr:hypothetical protein [Deltaproteobacteria bacterium]